MNKSSADAQKSYVLFRVRDGGEYDQVSDEMTLAVALEVLNEVRDMNPSRKYAILFRVDA